MNLLNSARGAVIVCAALAGIAGCGSWQPVATPGSIPRNAAIAAHGRSWMLPGTSSGGDLLYVAGRSAGLYVLTYPQGQRVGEVNLPYAVNSGGICSDASGDVFVPDVAEIVEFAHGGTQPIAILDDGGGYYFPTGCSVDPTTGNLAVTNSWTDSNGPGNVAIYADAQGEPTYYSDSKIRNPIFCGYDNQGDLFIDGGGPFAELPNGAESFTNITLRRAVGNGQVQWDGKYITVTSDNANTIYRLRVSGPAGKFVSTTHLKGPGRNTTSQSWIQGSTIIAPIGPGRDDDKVGFWHYPSGGKAFTIVPLGGHAEVVGATVSAGQ